MALRSFLFSVTWLLACTSPDRGLLSPSHYPRTERACRAFHASMCSPFAKSCGAPAPNRDKKVGDRHVIVQMQELGSLQSAHGVRATFVRGNLQHVEISRYLPRHRGFP